MRRRQRPALRDQRGEVHPNEVFHRDEPHAVVARAVVEDAHRVRARQAARRERLALEARSGSRLGAFARLQDLDRDVAPEAVVVREPDGPHSARSDLRLEPIAPESPRLVQLTARPPEKIAGRRAEDGRCDHEDVVVCEKSKVAPASPRRADRRVEEGRPRHHAWIDEQVDGRDDEGLHPAHRHGEDPQHDHGRDALDVPAREASVLDRHERHARRRGVVDADLERERALRGQLRPPHSDAGDDHDEGAHDAPGGEPPERVRLFEDEARVEIERVEPAPCDEPEQGQRGERMGALFFEGRGDANAPVVAAGESACARGETRAGLRAATLLENVSHPFQATRASAGDRVCSRGGMSRSAARVATSLPTTAPDPALSPPEHVGDVLALR